jgi:hypothetical protein
MGAKYLDFYNLLLEMTPGVIYCHNEFDAIILKFCGELPAVSFFVHGKPQFLVGYS